MTTNYTIYYNGNASRYKDLAKQINAVTEREAVETFYSEAMPGNYFPDEAGFIRDQSGDIIASPDSDCISYDGGEFYAVITDLFQTPEQIPDTIKAILSDYEQSDNWSYSDLNELQQNLEAQGYTIDWGLDAVPCNLRPLWEGRSTSI